MVNYVLKDGFDLTAEQFAQIKHFLENSNFPIAHLDFNDKKSVIKAYIKLKTCGEPVTDLQAERLASRFEEGTPRVFAVSKDKIDEFRRRVNDYFKKPEELNPPRQIVPFDYELGIRFHLGIGLDNKYHVVMVPVCGPKQSGCEERSHYGEWERKLFQVAGQPWFGLSFTELSSGIQGEFVTIDTARNYLLTKADPSTIRIAYFSYKRFLEFLPNLDFSLMILKLGRTDKTRNGSTVKELTVVYGFLDSNGRTLEDDGPGLAVNVKEVYFDQADLIPPPFIPDTDTDIDPH